MAQVSFETGQQIIAKSYEWARNLDGDMNAHERERTRVGYANGMLAIAAERDLLLAQRDALLAALKPFTRVSMGESRPGEYRIGWQSGDLQGLKVRAEDAVTVAREVVRQVEAETTP